MLPSTYLYSNPNDFWISRGRYDQKRAPRTGPTPFPKIIKCPVPLFKYLDIAQYKKILKTKENIFKEVNHI